MVKETKDFILFKKEFYKWQKVFGLMGYAVFFHYEPIEGGSAEIGINLEGMSADVSLNSEPRVIDKKFKDIKKDAKHEAIHLLIGRLTENGRGRFVSRGEIHESLEELVNKLEDLI